MANGAYQTSCGMCFIKHFSLAAGWYWEVMTGYPQHMMYLVGELGLAEIETKDKYPQVSEKIKSMRRAVLAAIDHSCWQELEDLGEEFLPVFVWAMREMGENFIIEHQEKDANKIYDVVIAWQVERKQSR